MLPVITRSAGHVTYTGFDRPDVEVLVDGTWCEGELWSWDRDAAGEWTGMAEWRRGPGQGNYLERFPASRIRLAAAPNTDG